MRDMNDVKAREEDYAELKALAARFDNLPAGFHLAVRERKLIHQGRVEVVLPLTQVWDDSKGPSLQNTRISGHHTPQPLSPRPTSPAYPSSPMSVNNMLPPRGSSSLSSPGFPDTDGRTRGQARRSLLMSSKFLRSPRTPSEEEGSTVTVLHAFVFSDVVILASSSDSPPSHNRKDMKKRRGSSLFTQEAQNPLARFHVLEQGGLGKILDVTDVSNRFPGELHHTACPETLG